MPNYQVRLSMAPKSNLLTAGTTNPFEKKPYDPFPITTQGKMQKAEAKRDELKKNVPREAPAATKKPGKPRSLPPPSEMEAAAKRRAEHKVALKGKARKDIKPITTQAKVQAAKAKQKALDPFGTAVKDAAKADAKAKAEKILAKRAGGEEAPVPAKTQPKRAVKAKAPGTLDVVMGHESTTIRYDKKCTGPPVMFRRTKKAEKLLNEMRKRVLEDPEMKVLWSDPEVQKALKACNKIVANVFKFLRTSDDLRKKVARLVDVGLLPAPGVLELDAVDLHGREKATFRFMDLPKELRLDIYRLVVVENRIFIRPDSQTGREQPDLAMVSRQVRSEVLPIFYGKNTFAVDVSPGPVLVVRPRGARPQAADEGMLRMAGKWVKAIGTPSHVSPTCSMSFIRNWIVDYAAPAFAFTHGSNKADDEHALMLSVRFMRDPTARNWSAVVEVHRDAACIMPGFAEHGTCRVKLTPEWVNEMVIEVCDGARGGWVTSEAVIGLAKALKPKMEELVASRCEVAKSWMDEVE